MNPDLLRYGANGHGVLTAIKWDLPVLCSRPTLKRADDLTGNPPAIEFAGLRTDFLTGAKSGLFCPLYVHIQTVSSRYGC